MIPNILIGKYMKNEKTYCLCESNFLYILIYGSLKLKHHLVIEHFLVTKENGTIYLYVEEEVFNKLSICEKIIKSMNVPQLIHFLNNKNSEYSVTESINIMQNDKEITYKAFIKLYTLPQEQLETCINEFLLERL